MEGTGRDGLESLFSSLTAWAKKLFGILVVLAGIHLNLLLEGRRLNRWCAGCDPSRMMFCNDASSRRCRRW